MPDKTKKEAERDLIERNRLIHRRDLQPDKIRAKMEAADKRDQRIIDEAEGRVGGEPWLKIA